MPGLDWPLPRERLDPPLRTLVDACRSGEVSADEEILGALHPTRRAELARLLPEAGMAGLPPASDSALPLFESMAELVERVAARQPLVLVLEDLHWADEMSLRLLAFVSRRIPAWMALLVTTARDEELADSTNARRTLEALTRGPQATPITLSPLSRADTVLLVRALSHVGTEAGSMARVEKHIWAMSEGNPFVAVEAMRALDQETLWGTLTEHPVRPPSRPACGISWPSGSTAQPAESGVGRGGGRHRAPVRLHAAGIRRPRGRA
jgi:hypothetical protein